MSDRAVYINFRTIVMEYQDAVYEQYDGETPGFRAAVTDYVENDAIKIEQVADTMYGHTVDAEELPESIQTMIQEQEESEDGGSSAAFQ